MIEIKVPSFRVVAFPRRAILSLGGPKMRLRLASVFVGFAALSSVQSAFA